MISYTRRMTDVPSVRATEVPDIRLKFLTLWGRPGEFRKALINRQMRAGMSSDNGNLMADMIETSVKGAELFWVSPSFMPLLLNASESLPDDSRFSELPPLPKAGLLVFDAFSEWYPVPDSYSSVAPTIAALSWMTGKNLGTTWDGKQFSGVIAEAYARFDNVWLNVRTSSWAEDDMVTALGSGLPWDEEFVLRRTMRDRRILAAFSHLITQETIADTCPERMPRPVQKRSERKNVPSTVRVVRLRHLAESERSGVTGSGVEYSHQWLVSGHWRNQPCGPGGEERKLIWVNPHIKGPADKPLVLKETVKALVR